MQQARNKLATWRTVPRCVFIWWIEKFGEVWQIKPWSDGGVSWSTLKMIKRERSQWPISKRGPWSNWGPRGLGATGVCLPAGQRVRPSFSTSLGSPAWLLDPGAAHKLNSTSSHLGLIVRPSSLPHASRLWTGRWLNEQAGLGLPRCWSDTPQTSAALLFLMCSQARTTSCQVASSLREPRCIPAGHCPMGTSPSASQTPGHGNCVWHRLLAGGMGFASTRLFSLFKGTNIGNNPRPATCQARDGTFPSSFATGVSTLRPFSTAPRTWPTVGLPPDGWASADCQW